MIGALPAPLPNTVGNSTSRSLCSLAPRAPPRMVCRVSDTSGRSVGVRQERSFHERLPDPLFLLTGRESTPLTLPFTPLVLTGAFDDLMHRAEM